jgi:ElaB/YqjD/DUF883 family membrane-anchored ribosome-binding protein
MQTELVKKTLRTGGKALALGMNAERMKEQLTHQFEDGMAEAKRALKRSRHAAEDLLDDTEYNIKQNPWRTVGLSLGLGLGIGALAGWLAGRRLSRTCAAQAE